MKFNLDRAGGAHVVRAYAPGRIRIGDRDFETSLIVTATDLIEPWRPGRIAALEAADLEPVVALAPEVLLIGTGSRQAFPDPAVFAALHAARIGFEVMDTRAACRTYNVLVAENRKVAAALLIE